MQFLGLSNNALSGVIPSQLGLLQDASVLLKGNSFTTVGDYTVEITLNNCTDTATCTNVVVTGISELGTGVLNIFPNPAQNILNISTPEMVEQVLVYSMSGTLVELIETDLQKMDYRLFF